MPWGKLAGLVLMIALLPLITRPLHAARIKARREQGLPDDRAEWVKAQFANYSGVFLLIFFGTVIALGIGWYQLLSLAGDVITAPGPDVLFQIDARHFFWCVPSFLLSLALAAPVVNVLCRRLFPRWYPEYEQSSRLDRETSRTLRRGAFALVAVCAAFFVCQVRDVTRLSSSGISLGHFGAFTRPEHLYADLASVSFTPLTRDSEGHVQDRPRWDLRFKDGSTWTTESVFRDMDPRKDREAFQFAALQAGIEVQRNEPGN